MPAGFLLRLRAYIVDAFVVGAGLFFTFGVIFPINCALAVMALLGIVSYEVAYTASSKQATPGKELVGLRVTTINGEDVGVIRSIVRWIPKTLIGYGWFIFNLAVIRDITDQWSPATQDVGANIYWLLLAVDCLLVAFTPNKRALHDYIAGTMVLYNNPSIKY